MENKVTISLEMYDRLKEFQRVIKETKDECKVAIYFNQDEIIVLSESEYTKMLLDKIEAYTNEVLKLNTKIDELTPDKKQWYLYKNYSMFKKWFINRKPKT